MSFRRRRALLGLIAAVAALAALPASALAAGESIAVTPSDLQTGGSPAIGTALAFDQTKTPQTVVINLAPGLLSNINANPSCIVGAPQFTPACDIGTATIDTSILPVSGDMYLVAPQSATDIAGIDVHITTPLAADAIIGVSFNPSSPGGLTLTSNLPTSVSGVALSVTALSTTFNATVNSQPFNRLPTNCSVATSTMTVTYTDASTGSGSGSFTPTGCDSLPYSPNLSPTVTTDPHGNAELKTVVTQAADEAASKAISIKFPSGLTPNAGTLAPCLLSGTGCTIGTASATSPLMPSTLNGTVILGGSITAPTFAISFPAPVNLTINGSVDLTNGSVTFSNVPDVPLTNLTLDITGVGGQRAFITNCQPGSVTGTFTGQGGQMHTATAPITYHGCPLSTGTGGGTGGGTGTGPSAPHGSSPKPGAKPKASGSVAGLASGHPRLTFKLTAANGAKIASVAAGLPRGLKFSRSAIVSHKVCAKKGNKKKCTTTVRVKGLRILGGGVKTVALKSGRLVITLKKAVARLTLKASGPLLTETKSLQTKVKKHKAGTLRFTLKLTTAKRATTSLTLQLKAH